jgi:hypothetical protein
MKGGEEEGLEALMGEVDGRQRQGEGGEIKAAVQVGLQ